MAESSSSTATKATPSSSQLDNKFPHRMSTEKENIVKHSSQPFRVTSSPSLWPSSLATSFCSSPPSRKTTTSVSDSNPTHTLLKPIVALPQPVVPSLNTIHRPTSSLLQRSMAASSSSSSSSYRRLQTQVLRQGETLESLFGIIPSHSKNNSTYFRLCKTLVEVDGAADDAETWKKVLELATHAHSKTAVGAGLRTAATAGVEPESDDDFRLNPTLNLLLLHRRATSRLLQPYNSPAIIDIWLSFAQSQLSMKLTDMANISLNHIQHNLLLRNSARDAPATALSASYYVRLADLREKAGQETEALQVIKLGMKNHAQPLHELEEFKRYLLLREPQLLPSPTSINIPVVPPLKRDSRLFAPAPLTTNNKDLPIETPARSHLPVIVPILSSLLPLPLPLAPKPLAPLLLDNPRAVPKQTERLSSSQPPSILRSTAFASPMPISIPSLTATATQDDSQSCSSSTDPMPTSNLTPSTALATLATETTASTDSMRTTRPGHGSPTTGSKTANGCHGTTATATDEAIGNETATLINDATFDKSSRRPPATQSRESLGDSNAELPELLHKESDRKVTASRTGKTDNGNESPSIPSRKIQLDIEYMWTWNPNQPRGIIPSETIASSEASPLNPIDSPNVVVDLRKDELVQSSLSAAMEMIDETVESDYDPTARSSISDNENKSESPPQKVHLDINYMWAWNPNQPREITSAAASAEVKSASTSIDSPNVVSAKHEIVQPLRPLALETIDENESVSNVMMPVSTSKEISEEKDYQQDEVVVDRNKSHRQAKRHRSALFAAQSPAALQSSGSSDNVASSVDVDTASLLAQANPDFLPLVSEANILRVNNVSYAKLGVIGKGGSCKVYKALTKDFGVVAIKKVKLTRMDRNAMRAYANEIDLLKRLRGNSAIINMYDSEVDLKRKAIFLVMEQGETDLNHVLQEQLLQARAHENSPQLDMNFVRLMWRQMLVAVDCIHEARIVHGDLKPANFLFVKGVLKLIDFGIAKAIQSDDTTNIYRDSQIGTINYMSPEAISADSSSSHLSGGPRMKLGRASDIWSLGCILYQMVYGRPPFAEFHMIQKLQLIVNSKHVIPFPEINDKAAIDAMKRCLQRKPEDRPSIAGVGGLLSEHRFLHPYSTTLQSSAQKNLTQKD